MQSSFNTIFNFLKNTIGFQVILTCAILAYLLITAPAFFQENHVFKNLEPYPDGLLYSLSAKNFVETGRFQLEYQDSTLRFWVQPLYGLLLIPGYILSSNVTVFYLSNIILGAGVIFLLSKIIWSVTKNPVILSACLLLYLVHGYILLIPTLPMAENASLLFFSGALYFLLSDSFSVLKKSLGLASMALLLLLTKSAALSIAVFFLVTAGVLYFCNLSKNSRKKYLLIGIPSVLIISLVFSEIILEGAKQLYSIFMNLNKYFSLFHTVPNISKYLNAIIGPSGDFLWWQVPLSAWPLLAIFLSTPLLLRKLNNKLYERSLLLLGVFVAQFYILIIFYEVDARYIIYTVPLLLIQLALFLSPIKNLWLKLALTVFLFALLVIQQKPLLHQIIAANILGRSHGWQYEAVKHFDDYFSTIDLENVHLITALPPFLVGGYSSENYRVVPLSKSQEFLHKKEYVWGSDLEYNDLLKNYRRLIEQNEAVFISNSYITHQQKVINDYESYKNFFEFELVSEGCSSACNVYKLSPKQ